MKNLFTVVLVILAMNAWAQVAPNYYAIEFTDKNDNAYSLDNPEEFLTQRSIDRRERYNIPYHITDLPITESYVEAVANIGVDVKRRVKWINTILIKTTNAALLDDILALPFVAGATKISDVNAFPPIKAKNFFEIEKELEGEEFSFKSGDQTSTLDYGQAYQQISILNGIPLHDAGFQGQGMVIAVLDGGFIGVPDRRVFDSIWINNQILGTRDFASEENNAFSGSTHGTKVLSTMGANWPGQMIGTAPKADYWLIRTEFTDYENIIEEYNWLVGAAFADSVGADVINSSLGYTTFDDASMDHTWAELDGNTTIVTKGADLAAAKGMLPVNSAGNEGSSSWQYISSPADGDSVFAIGAVNGMGILADFSSRGVPTDPRIKPNICAIGSGTTVADAYNDFITSGSGTSFSSPTVAGMTACLWQANIEYNNKQIMEALEMSGDRASNPNRDYGYGIPDYSLANTMVGISHQNTEENLVELYPNPANKQIFIQNIADFQTLKLMDINGKILLETALGNDYIELNINSLTKGIYIVQLLSDKQVINQKFIKQ